jgi:hypothetical protein
MHNQFQKDLCKLRHSTAKAYLGLLDNGVAPMAYAQGSQIRLTANVSLELLLIRVVWRDRSRIQNKALATEPKQDAYE